MIRSAWSRPTSRRWRPSSVNWPECGSRRRAGDGGGVRLLETALNWARTVGAIGVRLWVIPANTAAVRFYTRHGFEPVGDLQPGTDDPAGKVYMPMLLTPDEEAAASPTFITRARAPWTDESG